MDLNLENTKKKQICLLTLKKLQRNNNAVLSRVYSLQDSIKDLQDEIDRIEREEHIEQIENYLTTLPFRKPITIDPKWKTFNNTQLRELSAQIYMSFCLGQ